MSRFLFKLWLGCSCAISLMRFALKLLTYTFKYHKYSEMFSAIIILYLFHVIFCSQSQKQVVLCDAQSSHFPPSQRLIHAEQLVLEMCDIYVKLNHWVFVHTLVYICLFNVSSISTKPFLNVWNVPQALFDGGWHQLKVLVKPRRVSYFLDDQQVQDEALDAVVPIYINGKTQISKRSGADATLPVSSFLWFNCTLDITGSQSIVQYGSVLGVTRCNQITFFK